MTPLPDPDPANASDQELATEAAKGSEAAFRTLVRRDQTPVFKLIRRMVRRDDVAEELTQDTFVKMLDGLDTYRHESRFSAWLFAIATHVALNHLSATRREYAALERAPQAITPGRIVGMGNPLVTRDSTTDKVRQREIARALDRALDRLPDRQRVCFVLHVRHGRSYQEIAEDLGVPKGTVGSCIHRARSMLRDDLGPEFDLM